MLPRYLILLLFLLFTRWESLFALEVLKPHWTGKHCSECHLEDNSSEKGTSLRNNGHPVELCTRCHNGNIAPAETHPFGVQLLDYMKQRILSEWPLGEGKITCLTCHDVLIQMSENPIEELVNPQFVRHPYSISRNDFCFICHQATDYQKQNPHRQYEESGTLKESTCLFCHLAIPNPEQENPLAHITFKNDRTRLCISCHGGKKDNHPTRGNHLVPLPDNMKEEFVSQTAKRGVYLPLQNNTISCTTCHNPHHEGVIKRKEAAAGSGKSSFLRISRGRDLCTTCHSNLKLPRIRGQREAVSSSVLERTIDHKPYREEKCKACHSVEGFNQFRRGKLFLCFQKGCHEPTMLEHSSVHDPSVLGSCTFCHNPHSSGYEKLLFNTEDRLCSTCHPLLRDKNNSYLKVNHERLLSFTTMRSLPTEYECSFCHNLNHKKDILAVSTDLCSDCHLYLRENFSQNQHKQSTEKSCSACHDPHTSPHHYQLRKPPDTYSW